MPYSNGPTERQLQVLRLLGVALDGTKPPPTTREICAKLGISSTKAVHDLLLRLARRGLARSWGKRGWWATAEGFEILFAEAEKFVREGEPQ